MVAFTHYPLLDEKGEITEWFGTGADITYHHKTDAALQNSDNKHRTLFNSKDEGFYVIEVLFDGGNEQFDYLFMEANPAFEKKRGSQVQLIKLSFN